MQSRRQFFVSLAGAGLGVALLGSTSALAQAVMPGERQMMRQLEAEPRRRMRQQDRVTVDQLKRRPDLRREAPSIDIQAINFAFDSAEIPRSQYSKVEQIARALRELLRRRRGAVFLLEGHTDAPGSASYNLALSERRAASLKSVLVREFRIPSRALETVGYGEEYLLVATQREDWRNRRVTIRRVDDFLR